MCGIIFTMFEFYNVSEDNVNRSLYTTMHATNDLFLYIQVGVFSRWVKMVQINKSQEDGKKSGNNTGLQYIEFCFPLIAREFTTHQLPINVANMMNGETELILLRLRNTFNMGDSSHISDIGRLTILKSIISGTSFYHVYTNEVKMMADDKQSTHAVTAGKG